LFPVGTIGGSLFFVKAEEIKKVGLFDEGVFLFFEEDILSRKFRSIRKKVGIVPGVHFIHKGSSSISKSVPQFQKEKIMLESQRYFILHYLKYKKGQLFLYDTIAKIYLWMLPAVIRIMKIVYRT